MTEFLEHPIGGTVTDVKLVAVFTEDGTPLVTIEADGRFVAHQPERITEAAELFWRYIERRAKAAVAPTGGETRGMGFRRWVDSDHPTDVERLLSLCDAVETLDLGLAEDVRAATRALESRAALSSPVRAEPTGECSRCRRSIADFRAPDGSATAGYYVAAGWEKYADPGDVYICDACMWTDPRYIADYGSHAAATLRPAANAVRGAAELVAAFQAGISWVLDLWGDVPSFDPEKIRAAACAYVAKLPVRAGRGEAERLREAVAAVERSVGCGDHGCLFKPPTGVGTNGTCRCHSRVSVMAKLATLYRAAAALTPTPPATPTPSEEPTR